MKINKSRVLLFIVLVVLLVISFSSFSIQYYILTKLNLPLSIILSEVREKYEYHMWNGDGVEIYVLALNTINRNSIEESLIQSGWCNSIIPENIKDQVLEDGIGGELGFKFYKYLSNMNDRNILWIYKNRYSIKYNHINDLSPSQNYTYSYLDIDSGILFYLASDS